MAEPQSWKKTGAAIGAALLAIVVGWRICSKYSGSGAAAGSGSSSTGEAAPSTSSSAGSSASGLSAPIAAAHAANGDVVVAGLDVPAKAIRVQRINSKDEIVADRTVLADVAWSTDSDLKVAASAEGVAVTWRGLHGGRLVRRLVVLGSDLAPKGEPTEVAAASCATRNAVWFSDGVHAVARPWTGAALELALPKEKDASLLCGPTSAFAVLEEEERTSILPLGADGGGAPITMMRENEFGEDEQRELSEYTVGSDVGFVRLGGSGAIAVRELVAGAPAPLHKLKTTIPKDDDVIAVDASAKILVIVYTQDVSAACPPLSAGRGDTVVSTKVMALRVDRQTFEESTVELSPGRCGHEVGPFFTGALGDAVSVAWAERTGGAGRARAPIVGLAHALVAPTTAPTLGRIEQGADALVDATCDGTTCYAAALARREGMDAMAPGFAKVLRYK